MKQSVFVAGIPSHWMERRAKYFFREVDERSVTGSEELLSVSHITGVTPRSQKNVTMFMAESNVGHKVCRPGDLVVNTMWAWMGALGVSRQVGIVSPSYAVYRPSSSDLLPEFVDLLLRTQAYVNEYNRRSTGISSSRLRLYPDRFLSLCVVCPPQNEQSAILRFLAYVDARVRAYVAAKRKLIALLTEQKQAVVRNAVTRGIDPDISLKPSGIDWLGDIPQHWEIRRAKQVCTHIIDCKNRTPPPIDGGAYTVVRTTNVRHGRFSEAGSYPTDRTSFEIWTQRGAPRSGDVFFTREAPAGEACLVPDRDDLCMGQRMMYFRPDAELLDPEFLLHTIYGPLVRRYIDNACNGSTVGHLRLGQVYSLPLLWCPLEEQRKIVEHIRVVTDPLQLAVTHAHREIDLAREFRSRLIADVATGKLDVREVELPDVAVASPLELDAFWDENDDAGEPLEAVA